MTHSDVIIGHVVTSSVKLHQEAPENLYVVDYISGPFGRHVKKSYRLIISLVLILTLTM